MIKIVSVDQKRKFTMAYYMMKVNKNVSQIIADIRQ